MEKQTEKRAKSSGKKVNNKRKIVLAVSAFAVLGVTALAMYTLSAKNIVKEWENKIYPGVTVQGVNVGGMTKEEAKEKLTETLEKDIGSKKLTLEIEDKQYELIYSDIIPKYDLDESVEQAYKFGKENGILKKYMAIKYGEKAKSEISSGFSYDEEKLKEYEVKLQANVNQPAKDASITINDKNIEVNPEVEGKTLNLDTLDQKLKENINGNINSTDVVKIDMESTKPRVTKEDLSKIKDVIGTFSTNYGTSAPGRCNNIEIATAALNGTVVMPGETFSFNDVVGPRTVERGYKEAGTYVGDKVEPGIGGGICQVSTTLYRAAMKANLRSVERTNHSMVVGYAQPGLDATVSYGYLDYKFKNTYDFPIYIQGTTSGEVVTYTLYGDSSALNGKTYDMVSEILETIPPETKVVPDSSLPEGKEVNEGGGMTGYRARSYQITYENGTEANREIVSTDTYASVGVTVRKGTQQPTSNATNTNDNANTPQPADSQAAPPTDSQPTAPPPGAQVVQ